jgi:ABC-type multidrug transport system ATPase subunit/pSer/pThr/pTyr-binding forkhead associated (FHA) protein/ABC-type multidrug transport system permease subunit
MGTRKPEGQRTAVLLPGTAALVIQDEGSTFEAPLGDRPLTLGRDPASDVVLASRFVSVRHARIEPDGVAHRIADVGSTNGLLFEGRRLAPNTPLTLADGDVLRIGDPATGSFVSLTYRNPLATRAPLAAARSFPLRRSAEQTTIGRAASDVTLDNPQVSRQHALIERTAQGHVLRDLDSANGTFVNGGRVTQHALTPGDIIQIGAFKLVYDGDSLDEYDQRGALRIDARNLWRELPGGRMILKDVSLSISPREFVAIVGGSGTGKSTLLNALAGFAQATHGSVLVNGDDYYRNFDAYRALLGYVPQDDILHRELPVERALGYAAALRLPADTAPAEAARRIAQVLEDVEMTTHRATRVDALSGGQRKRVSIAAELLADPSLFFLDEATSGLDPGLEKKLMYTLRRLADSGRTVVLVTHATANISQCDHVIFMADGRMVFFGPPAEAPAFFGVASGEFADIYTKIDSPAEAETWEQTFRASPLHRRFVAGRLARAPEGPVTGSAGPGDTSRPRVSALRQLGILTRRALDLLAQDRRNLAILLLQAPLIGLLLALVAEAGAIVGPDATLSEGRKVLFLLATVAVWFGVINAAREVAREAAIYRRERLANLRIVPYLLSKVAVLALLVAVQSLALLALVSLKVQLPAAGLLLPLWPELFVTTFLTALAGLGLGLALSALAATPERAASLVPLALIPQILFAGVIFPLGDGITAQRVLSWLTVSRWAMDAYGASANLGDLPFAPGMLRLPNPPAEYTYTPEHLLARWVILAGYAVICLVVAGGVLRGREE